VAIAIEEAERLGIRAIVSVADPAMSIVALGRADGATPHSVETSRRKAITSASTRRVTGWMDGAFAITLPLGTGTLLTNVRGGVPIAFGGIHVGGLGVAGGAPEQDEQIAIATLAVLGADPIEPSA
jgi:uncharacterized protein GlcG (DUF336 family)